MNNIILENVDTILTKEQNSPQFQEAKDFLEKEVCKSKENKETLYDLDSFIKAIEDHEDSFIGVFCKADVDDVMALTGIYWSVDTMKVEYVLESGCHIGDGFEMEKWNEWYRTKV